jgi:hypothetical protein
MPKDKINKIDMIEKELSHGRLAMIGAFGMIIQEYVTGYPVLESLKMWIQS